MKWMVLPLILITQLASGQLRVEDFREPDDEGDECAIQRAVNALNEKGHGSIEFEGTRTYRVSKPIYLPKTCKVRAHGMRQFVLNGNGCVIVAGSDSVNIFDRQAENQNEALNKMMNFRFLFKNFTFVNGRKGINLSATYGSSITECEFKGQKEACIDVQFGLNTRITHCQFTVFGFDGIRLRHGIDWGGTKFNSQSNHSVVESCRFYTKKGANSCISVIASGGVRIKDLITEGSHDIQYGVYFNAKKSTTVKTFWLENYHLEHAPQVAGIYISIDGHANINGLYYQHAYKDFPVIWTHRGIIVISHIPYWVRGSVLKSDGAAWRLRYVKPGFARDDRWLVKPEGQDEYERKRPQKANFKMHR